MSRPLFSFTVEELDALPVGARFGPTNEDPERRDVWAMVKSADGKWRAPHPSAACKSVAYTGAEMLRWDDDEYELVSRPTNPPDLGIVEHIDNLPWCTQDPFVNRDVIRSIKAPPDGYRWCIHCGATYANDFNHDAVCEKPGTKEAINGLFDDTATLRARLQERYERPERPCTYDPDGDPLWFERARAQLEAPPVEPVLVMSPANAERFNRELAAACAMPERYDPADEEPEAEPLEYSGIPVVVDPKQEEGTVRFVGDWSKHLAQAFDPLATRYPSDMFAPVAPPMTPMMPESTAHRDAERAHFAKRYPEIMAEVLGTGPDRLDSATWFRREQRQVREAEHLRSYLRTLTNPDATPEGVNAALDALTPEDRALVSEALPSWGSARMVRFEAIAPFMARFERLVRDRDPRANEEGTLILSALLEDDPTRSTVEALMEIAKTPKVNP